MSAQAPELFFTLFFGDDVADPCRTSPELVTGAAEAALARLLARLGVPAVPRVALEAQPAHAGLRLFAEDVPLPLPESDVRRLARVYAPGGTASERLALIAALVSRAAEANAAHLLGNRQALHWIAEALARRPAAEPIHRYADCTRAVLRAQLAQGIAITDVDTICRHLLEGLKSRRRTAAIAESLIARLQPDTLDIAIEPAYAQLLFDGIGERALPVSGCPLAVRERCEMLRDGLFYELGVRIPPLRIVPDASLPAGAFRLRSGAGGWAPWAGLEPGQLLASAPADTLELHGISGTATTFPPNDSPAAVVPAAAQAELDRIGVGSWDPIGFMVLAAARDIRAQPGVLLDIDAVESSLAQLEQAFPELVYAALEKVSATDLTRVLRRLLASGVSIRNLRSILERLLAYDFVTTDVRREIAFDPRLQIDCRLDPRHEADLVDRYTEFVRAGLQLWLSHRSPGPPGTVVVQLLDPDTVERPVLDELAYRQAYGLGRPLGSARLQAIRDAIRRVADEEPAAILTVPQVASFLRAELHAEFPQLPVLSYQELAWDVSVQPIGRISV
jgi:hypothetical protein